MEPAAPPLTFALQALLQRHEAYVSSAEDDRVRFETSIARLEREKAQVVAENARIVEENRELLDQLEGMNRSVSEADSTVRGLTESLDATEMELRRVTVSAARVASLEEQLGVMESEQSRVQETLAVVEEDKRSAVQGWRKAESLLRDVQDQVDRVEREAREERERHAEMIQRMQRRRAVERELDGAAGRLKGAAAASELRSSHNQPAGSGSGSVVSRFVRDILQDNANLQMGVMELRDLLETSNQEVQNLREQLLSVSDDKPALPLLSEELNAKEPAAGPGPVSREFHIHHHYHKRPNRRKKRLPLRSASGTQLSRHPSTPTILSQTAVSIPPFPPPAGAGATITRRRWSHTPEASVSLSSSPQSIFDREESQPTSPDSTVFSSPSHRKRSFEAFRSLNGLDDDREGEENGEEDVGMFPTQPAIPEDSEPDDVFYSRPRRTSHDSLFSVAGMDIHTPVPPRRILSVSQFEPFSSPSPTTISTTTTTITADREPSASFRSPKSVLASVAATVESGSPTQPSAHPPTPGPRETKSLGRRMGGWVKGRWGIGASASASASASPSTESGPESRSRSTEKRNEFRFPGVNQSGPIRGFKAPPSLSASAQSSIPVQVESLDRGLLEESLGSDLSG